MPEPRVVKVKVCLVGELAVGKTSLIRRFTTGHFFDRYSTTLGVNVSKKTVDLALPDHEAPVHLEMMIWDVMGQRRLRELLMDSYFNAAQGIVAVCDVTRKETLEDLPNWVDMVAQVAGKVPVLVASNKVDLAAEAEFGSEEGAEMARAFEGEWLETSAKTGENVEELFRRLGVCVVQNLGV